MFMIQPYSEFHMLSCNGSLGTALQLKSKTQILVKFQQFLKIYHHTNPLSSTQAKNEQRCTSYTHMVYTGTTLALVYDLTLNATNVVTPLLKVTQSPYQYYQLQEIKTYKGGVTNAMKFMPGFIKIQQLVPFLKTYRLTNSISSQNLLKNHIYISVCVCVCVRARTRACTQT